MNVADQNALQEQPHKTHKANILEKQCDSAMKNCSAPSNVEHEQTLSVSLTFVVHLLSQMKLWRNGMARAELEPVQIRLTLQDAEVLSSRVKTESIQYEIMTVVISSLRMLVRTKCHEIVSPGMQGYSYYVVNHDFKVV